MTHSPLADAAPSPVSASDSRPDFITRLGLLLPCSVEDVEAAYRDHAKQSHPDAGGTTAEFTQLQSDYEAALEYARFHASRRGWLAANVERYAALQEVIAEIERRGGSVEVDRPDWIAREVGDDFAQMLDTVTGIRLTGPTIGQEDVQYLAGQLESLANLHRLDLSDSRVDHRAVKYLAKFPTLHDVDLSGTYAGNRTAAALAGMPALRRVNLADTFVTWRGLFTLRFRRPDLEVVTRCCPERTQSSTKRGYRWLLRALVVYFIAMLIATHSPPESDLLREPRWPGADKLVHFGIYCGLTALLAFVVSLRNTDRRSRTGLSAAWYAAIALSVAVFAAVDEFTQPWTGRDRDIKDWTADLIGMAVGLMLFTAVQLYRRRAARDTVSFPPVADPV